MVNDSEPRYRLLDSNGTVRGSLYINSSNQVVLQEATNDNEIILQNDGGLNLQDSLSLDDATADPGTNGVIQRNGSDVKVYSGGGVRNISNIGSGSFPVTQISSNTTTSGPGIYLVDSSGGGVTLTLASSDTTNKETIGVVNISGSNAVTVDTEGGGTIDPGGASSKTLSTEGYLVWFSGDGTNWDSSLDIDAETITGETVDTGTVENNDYHEGVTTQSGSTGDLDLSASNLIKQTVTGNITFSFNNASSSPAGNSFLLIVEQDATGGHSISWPSAVEWDGGSAPGVSTSANDTHVFSFVSPDGGTTWYGFLSGKGMA